MNGVGSALLISALVLAPHELKMEVRPQTILAGGSVTIVCRVPRMQARRWLEIGIEHVQLSGHQLDGNSQTLWLQDFANIPCDAGLAYCMTGVGKEPDARAFTHIQIGGCQPEGGVER